MKFVTDVLSSSSSSSIEYDDSSHGREYKEKRRDQVKKVNFITEHVVSTLDACGVTDAKGARILSAVAQALGYDLFDVVVSRSTIQRRRNENRKIIAFEAKKNFKVYIN